jgi:hypothetical protein
MGIQTIVATVDRVMERHTHTAPKTGLASITESPNYYHAPLRSNVTALLRGKA